MSNKAQREVIAHYPLKRLLAMGIGWSCILALLFYMIEDEFRDPGPKHGSYLVLFGVLLVVLLPIFLRLMRLVLRGIFTGGAALWIEGGRLFSAERRLGVPLADIVSVTMASRLVNIDGIYPAYTESIFFRLANGREAKIWAEFVENEGEVVAALQARIGLKVVGDMRSWH